MKKIAIIGAGGLGREVKYLIDDINAVSLNKLELIGYYDDAYPKGHIIVDDLSCLGKIEDLLHRTEDLGVVFGLGDTKVKKQILNKIEGNKCLSYPNIIHPNAHITKGVLLGKGNLIAYGCFISCDVEIGDFNFMNTYCAVGHDTVIGSGNVFMPRVQISGDILIGNDNFWGMSASIIQGKKVGDENKINGFTFITKSISNKRVYFGVPGKKIN
ncbi:acetyltransferase [Nonlabens sp. Asnod2-A12]|uniref:acetyltransferase n=1 Tax=Nonlabens sp. Asnod2-A12 TaxID=3160578 RepID=UPI003866612E